MNELTFNLETLMSRNPKTQADAMLCQAIAALSTQEQFAKMSPWDVFEHVKNTCQHWNDDSTK